MDLNNREFKAVINDMTHSYIGAQMNVEELLTYEDVPFKVKALFNKYFSKEEERSLPICKILSSVSKEDFNYQVLKQLKLKFKVGVYELDKKGNKHYKSKTLTVDEFLDIHKSDEEIFDEEVVFNKLALMAFSV